MRVISTPPGKRSSFHSGSIGKDRFNSIKFKLQRINQIIHTLNLYLSKRGERFVITKRPNCKILTKTKRKKLDVNWNFTVFSVNPYL